MGAHTFININRCSEMSSGFFKYPFFSFSFRSPPLSTKKFIQK